MSEFGKMNPYTKVEDKERYSLLGLNWTPDDWGMGGTIHFNDLKLDNLKKLADKGYIDMDECQNASPTTEDFMLLLEEYPEFHAHGYLVVNKRDDRRITIEGIESDTVYNTDEDCAKAESIIEELTQRIDDMGYGTEECGVYYDSTTGNNRIWLWWD